MPRYAFLIEYDGGPFSGWQAQAGGLPSVQGAIEAALARLDPTPGRLFAAGRTDAGVHATGQVAHVDLARAWDAFRLKEALNWHLRPAPIALLACAEVGEDFHARFSAQGRAYLFRLVTRRAPLTHDRGRAWAVGHELDLAAMRAGAAHLIGLHDFTTFRAAGCQAKSPVKTLDQLDIDETPYPGGQEFRFHLRARSFLHHQVRSIVGTLERVGAGAWAPKDVADALAAKSRAACGPVCPPDGLYLTHVDYGFDPFAGLEQRKSE